MILADLRDFVESKGHNSHIVYIIYVYDRAKHSVFGVAVE